MGTDAYISNTVSLKVLKDHDLLSEKDFSLVLKEDVWKKGILILKSGKKLTEEIIEKLLNFEIEEVSVLATSIIRSENEISYFELRNIFVGSQNILIIEKDIRNASNLINNLMMLGFNRKNIAISSDNPSTYAYLRDNTPDLIFINYFKNVESFIKYINKIPYFRETRIYLTVSNEAVKNNLNEITELKEQYKIKVIPKLTSIGILKKATDECIDNKLIEIIKKEATSSDLKYYPSAN